eukprot:7713688-Pyramimonas_sp.AAC.1
MTSLLADARGANRERTMPPIDQPRHSSRRAQSCAAPPRVAPPHPAGAAARAPAGDYTRSDWPVEA